MHTIDMTYDFVIYQDRHKGHVTESTSGEEPGAPTFAGTHDHWHLADVDTITLSRGQEAKVFWDAEIFGDRGDPERLLQEERDVALILNCEGESWIGRSEPTLDGRIGLAVYNDKGKVLMVGVGDLVTLANGTRRLQGAVENPFSWRAASPKGCHHLSSNFIPDQPYAAGAPDAGGGVIPDGGTRVEEN
jgi:hypothetical protein